MSDTQVMNQHEQAARSSRRWQAARLVASLALLTAASLIFISPQLGSRIGSPWHLVLWLVLGISAIVIGASLTRMTTQGKEERLIQSR